MVTFLAIIGLNTILIGLGFVLYSLYSRFEDHMDSIRYMKISVKSLNDFKNTSNIRLCILEEELKKKRK